MPHLRGQLDGCGTGTTRAGSLNGGPVGRPDDRIMGFQVSEVKELMAAGRQGIGPRWGARRAWVSLALVCAAAVPPALVLAAEQVTWPRELYNPVPRADDVLLPLPCGGAMAFRWVQAEGRVPADADPTAAPLYRLIGPFAREGRHDLLVGKYEVSHMQYEALPAMTGGPCPQASEAGRLVQGGVGWYDTMGFAARWSRWLAENATALPDCASAATLCIPRQGGRRAMLRLPTEAEWEYAGRGGLAVTPAQFGQPLYPMEVGLERHVWFERNSDQKLKPIGQRSASPLGLHDLYGNVEELTLGLYGSALFPGQSGAAVIRGGSVHTSRNRIDAGQRSETWIYGQGKANRAPDNGFRLIADLTAAPGDIVAKATPLPAPAGGAVAAVQIAGATEQIEVNVEPPAQVLSDDNAVDQAAPGATVVAQGPPVSEPHNKTAESSPPVAIQQSSASGTPTAVLTGASPSPVVEITGQTGQSQINVETSAQAHIDDTPVGQVAPSTPLEPPPLAVTPSPRAAPVLPTPSATPLEPRHPFKPEMVALPGGEFWMGSPEGEAERSKQDGPRHRVTLKPFAIGKYEVTFAQYDAFAQATGRQKPSDEGWGRDQHPVINVSWGDAVAYAVWLSTETGEKYRLPSEAEWEYAARAGTASPFWTGLCIHTDQANYYGNSDDYNGCGARTGVYRQKTVPVGSLPANLWGLHEVHGNVWEWVKDSWHDTYADAPADGSTWEESGSSARVLRGGAWKYKPRILRAANRNKAEPGYRSNFVGFRLAKTLPVTADRPTAHIGTTGGQVIAWLLAFALAAAVFATGGVWAARLRSRRPVVLTPGKQRASER